MPRWNPFKDPHIIHYPDLDHLFDSSTPRKDTLNQLDLSLDTLNRVRGCCDITENFSSCEESDGEERYVASQRTPGRPPLTPRNTKVKTDPVTPNVKGKDSLNPSSLRGTSSPEDFNLMISPIKPVCGLGLEDATHQTNYYLSNLTFELSGLDLFEDPKEVPVAADQDQGPGQGMDEGSPLQPSQLFATPVKKNPQSILDYVINSPNVDQRRSAERGSGSSSKSRPRRRLASSSTPDKRPKRTYHGHTITPPPRPLIPGATTNPVHHQHRGMGIVLDQLWNNYETGGSENGKTADAIPSHAVRGDTHRMPESAETGSRDMPADAETTPPSSETAPGISGTAARLSATAAEISRNAADDVPSTGLKFSVSLGHNKLELEGFPDLSIFEGVDGLKMYKRFLEFCQTEPLGLEDTKDPQFNAAPTQDGPPNPSPSNPCPSNPSPSNPSPSNPSPSNPSPSNPSLPRSTNVGPIPSSIPSIPPGPHGIADPDAMDTHGVLPSHPIPSHGTGIPSHPKPSHHGPETHIAPYPAHTHTTPHSTKPHTNPYCMEPHATPYPMETNPFPCPIHGTSSSNVVVSPSSIHNRSRKSKAIPEVSGIESSMVYVSELTSSSQQASYGPDSASTTTPSPLLVKQHDLRRKDFDESVQKGCSREKQCSYAMVKDDTSTLAHEPHGVSVNELRYGRMSMGQGSLLEALFSSTPKQHPTSKRSTTTIASSPNHASTQTRRRTSRRTESTKRSRSVPTASGLKFHSVLDAPSSKLYTSMDSYYQYPISYTQSPRPDVLMGHYAHAHGPIAAQGTQNLCPRITSPSHLYSPISTSSGLHSKPLTTPGHAEAYSSCSPYGRSPHSPWYHYGHGQGTPWSPLLGQPHTPLGSESLHYPMAMPSQALSPQNLSAHRTTRSPHRAWSPSPRKSRMDSRSASRNLPHSRHASHSRTVSNPRHASPLTRMHYNTNPSTSPLATPLSHPPGSSGVTTPPFAQHPMASPQGGYPSQPHSTHAEKKPQSAAKRCRTRQRRAEDGVPPSARRSHSQPPPIPSLRPFLLELHNTLSPPINLYNIQVPQKDTPRHGVSNETRNGPQNEMRNASRTQTYGSGHNISSHGIPRASEDLSEFPAWTELLSVGTDKQRTKRTSRGRQGKRTRGNGDYENMPRTTARETKLKYQDYGDKFRSAEYVRQLKAWERDNPNPDYSSLVQLAHRDAHQDHGRDLNPTFHSFTKHHPKDKGACVHPHTPLQHVSPTLHSPHHTSSSHRGRFRDDYPSSASPGLTPTTASSKAQ